MRCSRRDILRWAGVGGVAAVGGTGTACASPPPPVDLSALSEFLGTAKPELSADITLGLPVYAEAGGRVPVSIKTGLPNVESISLFVEKNSRPWAVTFRIAPPAAAQVRTQIRVESSCEVIVLVKTRNPEKVFYANADVIVTSPDGCP